jgi:PAS domain S-box-containing protein
MVTENMSPTSAVDALVSERPQQPVGQLLHERLDIQAEQPAFSANRTDFYDTAPVGYITLDAHGLVCSVNAAAASLLGALHLELLMQPLSHYIAAQDKDAFAGYCKQAARAGVVKEIELRMVRPDGSNVWVQMIGSQVYEIDGRPVQQLLLSDISGRQLLQARLQESEQRWHFAVDGCGDGLWDWNVVQGHVFYSKTWKQMLGYGEDQISSRPQEWESRIHPEDKAKTLAALKACLDGKTDHYTSEHRLRCNNGSYKWILDRGIVVGRGPDGKPVRLIGTHSDIDERKRIEGELAASRVLADAGNRAKSRFLAAASHDLRQPLSALSLFVGVLKKRTEPQNAELVGNIQNCVESLSELLTDLLDVSKLEAGVVIPKLADFAITDFLNTMRSVHFEEARGKGLKLRFRCDGQLACTDQQLLRRIVGNFIHNAIRYTVKGGVLVACRRHAGRQWIEVWDTGIGIAESDQSVIFEEFHQLDVARSKGTGLGLSIAAKMAALLGLEIRLRSRLGRGSMFAIELPAGQGRQANATRSTTPPVTRSLRIALVDDNANVLEALTLMLDSVGHQVVGAVNAADLLIRLATQPPDIIVSDYRLLAGQTGFDAIEAVRAAFGADLPAIIITGDTDPTLIRAMNGRGIDVHYKPLDFENLLAAIEASFERRIS